MIPLPRRLTTPRSLRQVVAATMLLALAALGSTAAFALPDGATARLGHGSPQAVLYSPDRKLLAVATTIGVEPWDTDTYGSIGAARRPWTRQPEVHPPVR